MGGGFRRGANRTTVPERTGESLFFPAGSPLTSVNGLKLIRRGHLRESREILTGIGRVRGFAYSDFADSMRSNRSLETFCASAICSRDITGVISPLSSVASSNP